jgi:hypothetical protein
MTITNALAYYDKATITAVKSFIVKGSEVFTIKLFTTVIFATSQ